jgi:hypothetical protein
VIYGPADSIGLRLEGVPVVSDENVIERVTLTYDLFALVP